MAPLIQNMKTKLLKNTGFDFLVEKDDVAVQNDAIVLLEPRKCNVGITYYIYNNNPYQNIG